MKQINSDVTMPPICRLLYAALQNIDWRFVSLSQVNYRQAEPFTDKLLERWQERPFAYEIYHQVRLLMEGCQQGDKSYVVQPEVRKGYQGLESFDYMPDFIFHLDEVGQNFAVVEIKMAARQSKEVLNDIKKLKAFRDKLGYQELVFVAIGKDEELARCREQIENTTAGFLVHFLVLSTDSHEADYRLIRINE